MSEEVYKSLARHGGNSLAKTVGQLERLTNLSESSRQLAMLELQDSCCEFILVALTVPDPLQRWMFNGSLRFGDCQRLPRAWNSEWSAKTEAGALFKELETLFAQTFFGIDDLEKVSASPQFPFDQESQEEIVRAIAKFSTSAKLDDFFQPMKSKLVELRKLVVPRPFLDLAYEFGLLTREGLLEEVKLSEKPMQKLLFDLVHVACGNATPNDELFECLWPGDSYTASRLSQLKIELNKAIASLKIKVDRQNRLVDCKPE